MKTSLLILSLLLNVLPNVSRAASADLACLRNSSSTDGAYRIDVEMKFHFESENKASLVTQLSGDGGTTWVPACASQGSLSVSKYRDVYKFAGTMKCVDDSFNDFLLTFDAAAMNLNTSPDGSGLVYQCRWL